MVGFRGAWVVLVCVGVLGGRPVWAQAPGEEASSDEVLSEEQLEQLLDSPAEQPSGAELTEATFGLEQLASYFAAGPLARARAEYDRGRYRRARALLSEQEATLPVRFLMAQSALNMRDFATAAEEFAALAEEYVPLRDHCRMRAAQATEQLRRLETAASHYRAVDAGSPLYPEARFKLARVLERRRDIHGALGALAELIESRKARGPDSIRMQALLATCDLARKQGQYNVEHKALLEVWATSPLSREAERARRRLAGLPLPIKWRVRRADALVDLHRNSAAMELLDGVLPHVNLPDPLSCNARLIYGEALRKERQHRKAIQVLTPVVQQCHLPEVRPQALYLLGYSQSVVDKQAAITTYDTLARDYPEHGYADDALFFEGWLLQRTGQLDTAMARYEELAQRYPAGNFASEALFRAFWLHQRRGERAAALAALQAVEQLPQAARTDEALWRARYWHARVMETQNEVPAALAGYERIATDRPATWYGMLARSRLALLAPGRLVRATPVSVASVQPVTTAVAEPAAEPGVVWPLPLGGLAQDPRFAAGVELMRLGMPGAVHELLAVDPRALSEGPARLLFQILQRTGRGWAARKVARSTLREEVRGPLSSQSRPIWEATWPLAYRTIIERQAKTNRLDPDLLQGLIREESRFNPRARSSTGALGLTQLMPATARQVAASLKLSAVGEQTLLQPADNVRLGAAYLGQLLKHFGGNAAFAVAAYNAGPSAVERWQKALPQADIDEWVEHITFDETREYVKNVLGSYNAYKLLYASQSPLLQISSASAAKEKGLAVREPEARAVSAQPRR
ncbi:transglycosylase SLT domain-containing protein [Hyalangium sp.]|uniref:lytic transglycosylase domain-containing protein n=1 Tax=Hyalangium sp. TaxID=2028555 RepID=UPI002D758329|nr:transglycosylase SLT domain-containing protein [Hyalangium sp.]HYH99933.1 transglycosylase SLT domain-containing protein [Hyalangium sp.]